MLQKGLTVTAIAEKHGKTTAETKRIRYLLRRLSKIFLELKDYGIQ